MSRSTKILTIVSGAAVALAITGAASALTGVDAVGAVGALASLPGINTVDSGDIIDGEVKTADIRAGAVTNSRIATDAVTSSKVRANALTGSDVNESTLNFSDTTCSVEMVHSFARIKGTASMPSTFTNSTAYVDIAHNCSGGTVQVRRIAPGAYYVRFNGDPAALSSVSAMNNNSVESTDNTIVVSTRDLFGAYTGFNVQIKDQSGAQEDGWFTIMTF